MKPAKKTRALTFVRTAITLAFILALVYYLSTIDLAELINLLKNAAWLWILPAAGLTLFIIYLKSARLRMLTPRPLPVKRFFRIQCISIFLATFTPARLGEFVKVWFLKQEALSTGSAVYIFFLERVTDLLILLLYGSLFYFFAVIGNVALGMLSILAFLLIVAALAIALSRRVRIPIAFLDAVFRKLHVDRSIHKKLAGTIPLSLLIWLLEATFLIFILFIFQESISIYAAAGIIGIAGIASLLSILPLGLGSVDFSIGYFLQQLGLGLETITATLIMMRVLSVLVLGTAGIISSGSSLKNIRNLIARAKETRSADSQP